MQTQPGRPREDKKRKRKARKALLAFLKRLRKACETIGTADDWYELLEPFHSLLTEYEPDLPAQSRQRLEDATRLTDVTREGIGSACDLLQLEIQQTVKLLPSGGTLGSWLIRGLFAGAATVGLGAAFLNLTAVEIIVRNNGCDSIPVAQGLPPGARPFLNVVGVVLPSEIGRNAEETVRVPPLPVEIDATTGALSVTVLGRSMTLDISGFVVDVELDGTSILGRRTELNLAEQPQHALIISCG